MEPNERIEITYVQSGQPRPYADHKGVTKVKVEWNNPIKGWVPASDAVVKDRAERLFPLRFKETVDMGNASEYFAGWTDRVDIKDGVATIYTTTPYTG